MSTINLELYSALRAAGVNEDMSRDAAVAVASQDSAINDIKSELKLIKWMIGLNTAGLGFLIAKALV